MTQCRCKRLESASAEALKATSGARKSLLWAGLPCIHQGLAWAVPTLSVNARARAMVQAKQGRTVQVHRFSIGVWVGRSSKIAINL